MINDLPNRFFASAITKKVKKSGKSNNHEKAIIILKYYPNLM